MVRSVILLVLLALGCSKHEDRHDQATAPSKLQLAVTIAGVKSTWGDAELEGTPRMTGKASDGEARDTWSLRELVQHNVGPGARVTAVIGADGTKVIDPAAWDDATRIPILHTTKRGALKFRWATKDGAWGETVMKDVTALEITK